MVLSIYFSTSLKSLYVFTSLSTVCLLGFPCVEIKERNQLYFKLPPSRPCKIGLGRIREPINQMTIALIILRLPDV